MVLIDSQRAHMVALVSLPLFFLFDGLTYRQSFTLHVKHNDYVAPQ